jgi:hypothetical protein
LLIHLPLLHRDAAARVRGGRLSNLSIRAWQGGAQQAAYVRAIGMRGLRCFIAFLFEQRTISDDAGALHQCSAPPRRADVLGISLAD